MKHIRIISVILLITSSASMLRCGPATVVLPDLSVSAIVDLVKEISDLISAYQTLSDLFKSTVSEATDKASNDINSESDLTDVAKFWEVQWDSMNSQYSRLNLQLKDINTECQDYFNRLGLNNEKIHNSVLKAKDREQNEKVKQQWDAEFNKAQEDLMKADTLIKQGEDFKLILTNTVAREEVLKSVNQLHFISDQAKILAQNIKTFSDNVQVLFKKQIESISPQKENDKNLPEIDSKTIKIVEETLEKKDDVKTRSDSLSHKKIDSLNHLISAIVNQVKPEFNIYQSGEKGLQFHVDFNVINMKYVPGRCIVYFYYKNGDPIKSTNTRYADINGQMCSAIELAPMSMNYRFDDLKIFMPYNEFKLQTTYSSVILKALICIYEYADPSNPRKVAQSDFIDLNIHLDN